MKITIPVGGIAFAVETDPKKFFGMPGCIFQRRRGTLIIATDLHYATATELVRRAKEEIVLCQRTSTLFLAPETWRAPEKRFAHALYSAIQAGVQVFHMIHEESCLNDVWRTPGNFEPDLGSVPLRDNVVIGRYRGEKPVPRLLVVDRRWLGVVFDIDDRQFYSVIKTRRVAAVAEAAKGYIVGEGRQQFDAAAFQNRLRSAKATADDLLGGTSRGDIVERLAQLVVERLKSSTVEPPRRFYTLPGREDEDVVCVPVAWPEKRKGVFFDSSGIGAQRCHAPQVYRELNVAVAGGWQCLLFTPAQLLTKLDTSMRHIQALVGV